MALKDILAKARKSPPQALQISSQHMFKDAQLKTSFLIKILDTLLMDGIAN
jgi:hypothetical protein